MPVFFSQKSFGRQKIKHNKNRKKYLEKETLLMEKLSVEELEELKEKEFDEIAERIQNTISLFRKIACVLAVIIAAAFIFFHVRKDYNNYSGSQLVMAEVVDIEGTSDKNISVTYRYNIASKEYESDKIQYTEKIKKGDKKEIRVKKSNPEVILQYNDVDFIVIYDVVIGLGLELAVLWLYAMATCMLEEDDAWRNIFVNRGRE